MNDLPCRKTFSDTLFVKAKTDPSIIVLTTDARFSAAVDNFAEKLPQQFIDVGIAEQNAIGIAAGLSKAGKKPFVFMPACFLTARCVDQIKVDVVYSKANVKLIGVSGGVSYGPLGYTHHAVNDIAIMRTFPGMTVILPADPSQTKAIAEKMVEYEGPAYIRMGRNPVPIVYEGEANFEVGKANILMDGSDVTIIGTGETTYHCLEAGKKLKKHGISAEVIDMSTIKPLDEKTLLKTSKKNGRVIVVEEHTIHGGLGSAIAEFLIQNNPVPVKFISLPDEFPISGSQPQIFEYYGLTCEKIVQKTLDFLERFRN
ncbi:MAG: transketolase family protein [Nitrososphaerota archaeon]|nr:transketolase family protein [Candidatus Bathyarchaeota archaeon]MDW8049391.1 transketolase family protein [Nitrososphaerota archaeon]